MIRNYITIAWRSLKKKKLYTIIHLVGLFTGICFALMIAAFVWQELQVNKSLKNHDRQYILTSQWKDPSMGIDFTTLAPVARNLKESYPHLVANYYRWDGISSIITNGTTHLREDILLGDETLLDIFGFEMLHGNPASAFKNPLSVVITEERAFKFFGRTDVINKTLQVQNNHGLHESFTITGVLKSLPENSINRITPTADNAIFISKKDAAYFDRSNFDNWENPYFVSYVELQKSVEAANLQQPLAAIIKQHTSLKVQQNLTIIPKKLTDFYLEKDNGAIKQMLYILAAIGLFILLMAVINFINISISHAGSRMREIGVRKVLGGQRKQLITQFLTESVVLVTLASIAAFIAYVFLRPLFSNLIGKELISLTQLPFSFIAVVLGFIALLGILSGLYPAFILASYNTIDALHGTLKSKLSITLLRKVLLGFQFITALVALITALIVTQQVGSFFGKGLGYTKDYVVTATVPRDWTATGVQNMLTVRDALEKIPSVEKVSLSYIIPDGGAGFSSMALPVEASSTDVPLTSQGLVTDASYLDTYKLELLAGTYFEQTLGEFNKVVINKKALQGYGFKDAQDAVGKQLTIIGEENPVIIEGVINDFHFESMQQPIKPQIIFNVAAIPNYRYLSFKIKPGTVATSLVAIQKEWSQLLPGTSFEYTFMDETLEGLYTAELRFKKAATIATLLALLIALLGIFGMVALSIHRRVKEIGIRKVLGASIAIIWLLFIKEFFIILIVAISIACPLAYWFMKNWMQQYAYQTGISIHPFLIAIAAVIAVTLALVMLQTLKIARTNPVKSLKTD